MAQTNSRAVVIVAAAAVIVGGWLMTLYPEPAWIPVRAEVMRVATSLSKDRRTTIVGLRTPTGIGEARFTDRLPNCQVGDIVEAEQSGVAIRRSAETCV